MQLLDGRYLAKKIKLEIKQQVKEFLEQGRREPSLAVIILGDNPASVTYVRNKMRSCEEVGFRSVDIHLPQDTTQDKVLEIIEELNNDQRIDGFIVQLPLPEHLDEQIIIEHIKPEKDVDGFHPENMGRTLLGLPAFNPATPKGIVEMLKRYDIKLEGKHVVIVGRSNIVGKPLAAMLVQRSINATITVCHSHTKDLASITRQGDILVAAVGKPFFISADMVKEGAVVVDVGINSIKDKTRKSGYRLVGDVDFEQVRKKASWISPVPGGVGQMTVAALLQNTLLAYKKVIYNG